LQIDILMHPREQHRPSSTGHLINRVIPGSRLHLWPRQRPIALPNLRSPGRELWILHPHGEPAPTTATPERIQVLLLDGSWSETNAMAKEVGSWGRLVSLPMTGESRYWLRSQQEGRRFSTVEALIFLLQALSLKSAGDDLRLQLELHVYASLRARGRKEAAAEFLQHSPIRAMLPELVVALNLRRPR
jgi:DTW domain-containing protein